MIIALLKDMKRVAAYLMILLMLQMSFFIYSFYRMAKLESVVLNTSIATVDELNAVWRANTLLANALGIEFKETRGSDTQRKETIFFNKGERDE
jgi:hypothetical protein